MFGPGRRFACRDWRSCAAILIAASFFSSGRASAATITVTTTADSGAGSLRDAIGIAAAGDDIIVPAGTYGLTSGPLQITAGVSITGAGAATTIIDGGGIDGVFHISIPDVPTESVEISGLTITNGAATQGGGIYIRFGTVMVTDSIITRNSASFGAVESSTGITGSPHRFIQKHDCQQQRIVPRRRHLQPGWRDVDPHGQHGHRQFSNGWGRRDHELRGRRRDHHQQHHQRQRGG